MTKKKTKKKAPKTGLSNLENIDYAKKAPKELKPIVKPAQKWSKKQVKFYKKQNPVVEIAAGCVMWAIPILPYGVIDPLDIAGTVLIVDGGRRIKNDWNRERRSISKGKSKMF